MKIETLFSMFIENTMTDVSEKKPFPEERAHKLALAREKALEVRKKNSLAKKKAEVEKMEQSLSVKEECEEAVEEEIEEEELPKPVAKDPPKVKKSKKKPTIIVEQSSEDEDLFEPNPQVVFVKRVRQKAAPPAPKPSPIKPPEPKPPSPQSLAAKAQEVHLQNLYNGMFGGHFLGHGRRR